MVRAIDNHAWRNALFLERVRPGLAISVILHAALLLALAYYLAFPPNAQPVVDEPDGTITVITVPRQPPPVVKPPETSTFKPTVIPGLKDIHTDVGPLVIPPTTDFDRGPSTVVTTTAPPATVIVNPRPINRGGLVYPDRALESGRTGFVDFDFVIEADGTVGDLRMIAETPSGYGFAAAAERAFAKWRFEPKLVDGKPVAAAARYRVSFQLN